MKTYKLIHVNWGSEGVRVRATDEQVIRQLHDDLVTVLQKEIPKFKVEKQLNRIGYIELDGGQYDLQMSKLRDSRGTVSGDDVSHWIKRWLCQHGWEPFAIPNSAEMYFRQEINE